jgi:multiple sugar transport system permease protein
MPAMNHNEFMARMVERGVGWAFLVVLILLGVAIAAAVVFLVLPYIKIMDIRVATKWRKIAWSTATYCTLTLLGAVFALPFIWLISTSFKVPSKIFVFPPEFIPYPVTKLNYTLGLKTIPFLPYLRNTLIICFSSVIGTVISSSLVAYGLSRIEWRGKNSLFMVILSTMMLPYQVIMVPMFAIFVWLGWIDTYLPLIVPTFLGNAFFIFLLRQFFMTIPKDLTEAAKIDGCSEFQIYQKVILPLAKPALATVGLFTFLNSWNDFLGPLIYIFDERGYTLSLGLAMFMGQYGSYWGRLMAVSVVVTVPIVILFFFTQKTFIQGITMSGIKG